MNFIFVLSGTVPVHTRTHTPLRDIILPRIPTGSVPAHNERHRPADSLR